ncbi:mitochondrial inheritance component mdm12 [Coccidioides immitis H538.4]|uniref:Mitochondrial distribution and morphology protein 12 n=1 Tax=Coccidioides immitis H538.4 TaxID=396776 RepID=A0A0J8RDB2_COCIT|nr:mitochondrial inheritance component mdm12 [Coccidioides immitis H538.4]
MSIDINWEAATSGPDGEALAERIRSFIHDKFQQIALPRFIRSVEVNSFDFGTIKPELQIKDLCDPFEDFYEEDEDNEIGDGEVTDHRNLDFPALEMSGARRTRGKRNILRSKMTGYAAESNPMMSRYPRKRIPGIEADPISNVLRGSLESLLLYAGLAPRDSGRYFESRLLLHALGGISGTQTPLSSVLAARSPRVYVMPLSLENLLIHNDLIPSGPARRQSEIDIDTGNSRPSTADTLDSLNIHGIPDPVLPRSSDDAHPNVLPRRDNSPAPRRVREKRPEDLQVLCRLRYNGNIRLSLTALVLLDYPMPNFVGLPLKLNITGLTFDGVAVVAYIRKRVHFCFLSPEDADTLFGADDTNEAGHLQSRDSLAGGINDTSYSSRRPHDSLLRDVRVESEIGRKEDGKQVLKNVGKVEKFVLEQVRRIFEEEFVYPSFWTFLV